MNVARFVHALCWAMIAIEILWIVRCSVINYRRNAIMKDLGLLAMFVEPESTKWWMDIATLVAIIALLTL